MCVYVLYMCELFCVWSAVKWICIQSVSMRAEKLLQARALGGRQCIPLKSRVFRVSHRQALWLDQLPDTINLLNSSQTAVGNLVDDLSQFACIARRSASQLSRTGVQCCGMRHDQQIASCKRILIKIQISNVYLRYLLVLSSSCKSTSWLRV